MGYPVKLKLEHGACWRWHNNPHGSWKSAGLGLTANLRKKKEGQGTGSSKGKMGRGFVGWINRNDDGVLFTFWWLFGRFGFPWVHRSSEIVKTKGFCFTRRLVGFWRLFGCWTGGLFGGDVKLLLRWSSQALQDSDGGREKWSWMGRDLVGLRWWQEGCWPESKMETKGGWVVASKGGKCILIPFENLQ